MAKPAYKLVINRKDGKDQKFTDYNGNKVSKKYRHVGAVWPSKSGEGFNVTIDKDVESITLDQDTYWISLYPVEERSSRDDESGHEARKPRTGGGRRRPAPKTEESDDDLFGEDE